MRIHSSQCISAIGGRALAHAAHPSSSPPDSEVWPSLDAAGSPQARNARSRGRGGPLSAGMFGEFLHGRQGKRNDSRLAGPRQAAAPAGQGDRCIAVLTAAYRVSNGTGFCSTV